MEVKHLLKFDNIKYYEDRTNTKYALELNGEEVMKFNGGRFKEFTLLLNFGIPAKSLRLDNVNHKIAGDIRLGEKWYNVKSYKCELVAKGETLAEKIDNYIEEDASKGLIYVIEHQNELYALMMDWQEARNFLLKFARIDSSNKVRLGTCDNKIFKWVTVEPT